MRRSRPIIWAGGTAITLLLMAAAGWWQLIPRWSAACPFAVCEAACPPFLCKRDFFASAYVKYLSSYQREGVYNMDTEFVTVYTKALPKRFGRFVDGLVPRTDYRVPETPPRATAYALQGESICHGEFDYYIDVAKASPAVAALVEDLEEAYGLPTHDLTDIAQALEGPDVNVRNVSVWDFRGNPYDETLSWIVLTVTDGRVVPAQNEVGPFQLTYFEMSFVFANYPACFEEDPKYGKAVGEWFGYPDRLASEYEKMQESEAGAP